MLDYMPLKVGHVIIQHKRSLQSTQVVRFAVCVHCPCNGNRFVLDGLASQEASSGIARAPKLVSRGGKERTGKVKTKGRRK